jgi:hypothetical protein
LYQKYVKDNKGKLVLYVELLNQVKSGEVRIEYCLTAIMIADYFTKALQGALFLKLQDMIMGNTNIDLPTNVIENNPDPSIGIPDGPAPQESRSVLKDEIVNNSSPCSLTVLPAFRLQDQKTTKATKVKTSKPVVSKRTVSWAEIASRNR